MAGKLSGKRVAFVVANEGIEQAELVEPWKAVQEAGGHPVLVAPAAGEAQAFNHLDRADAFAVDEVASAADAASFDGIVLPGGVANPDNLRTHPEAVALVRAIFEAGKPAAVICHGAWTIVEAGLVGGRTLTSWPSLQTDIRNAGGTWVDEQVHVDTNGPNTLITSRNPDDLPAFCRTLVEHLG